MARLRVRLELNRRSAGVPLDKLASVVEETRKFFHLLAEDVHIDSEHAEWVASDFDPEALNFTAEYSGAVSTEQVHAFGAAFAGATSLRRATIAQFTRIADFLGEDELVGFGLFQSDTEIEPSEWRCLSKRDAQRFGHEIRMLAEAAGDALPETSLPAVNGSIAGKRLFKDRREREALASDPARLIREIETNLSRRIDLLEGEVQSQSRKLRQIGPAPDQADERFQRLLSVMEKFWTQAPRQTPLLAAAAPAEPTPKPEVPEPLQESAVAVSEEPVAQEPAPMIEPSPAPVPAEPPIATPEPESRLDLPPAKKSKRWWLVGSIAAAAVAFGLAVPELQQQWSRYNTVATLPITLPKPPAPPPLPAPEIADAQPDPPTEKVAQNKPEKSPQRFEGPLIALQIPAGVRAKVSSEAQVRVVVAIDDQGNVTKAEVASTKGKGARLLADAALDVARRSHFRPAREGQRAVESQMVLTYSFKPAKLESAEF